MPQAENPESVSTVFSFDQPQLQSAQTAASTADVPGTTTEPLDMLSVPESSPKAAGVEEAAGAKEAIETTAPRKRPKPGERRAQILQTLASMLEQPGAERITTAALAAKLDVSEAALYRHFASKAQMFEGLIEFIEQSVFSLVNQIATRAGTPAQKTSSVVTMLLQFSEKNPGMTRVMVGDALVFENERLQQRMNQFFDKIEAALKQSLRGDAALESANATSTSTLHAADLQVVASLLTAFVMGRLQRFARSGFKRQPTEYLDASLAKLLQI